jgi:hypothetical protein
MRTGYLLAVQLVLELSKFESTVSRHAIEVDDAIEIAQKVNIRSRGATSGSSAFLRESQ